MTEKIIELKGKESGPGPVSFILAGVHGNERCGVEAMENILPKLEIRKGTVFFGCGNPLALESNLRFTEANLNRMFKNDSELTETDKKSYEYSRAVLLKKFLGQAEVLLDIHASQSPKSRPFVICEDNARSLTSYLPVNVTVSGFDETQPGGTDYYMNSIGKVGICVECGYLGDAGAVALAEESILAFLKARGHIDNDLKQQQQTHIHIEDMYITKSDNFKLEKTFEDFEELHEGQLIGKDGGMEVRAKKNGLILFARARDRKEEEGFLFAVKQ